MSRFRSGLETLLKIRERTQDAARLELAEATRRREDTRDELDAVDGELQAEAGALSAEGLVIPLMLLQSGHARCQILDAARRAKQQELEQVCCEHERAREGAVTAQRELKTTEKLHEKAEDAHLAQARRKEGKALDEVGGRQSGASGAGWETEGEPPWRSDSTG